MSLLEIEQPRDEYELWQAINFLDRMADYERQNLVVLARFEKPSAMIRERAEENLADLLETRKYWLWMASIAYNFSVPIEMPDRLTSLPRPAVNDTSSFSAWYWEWSDEFDRH